MILIVRIVCQGMVAKIHGILGKRQQKDRRILMIDGDYFHIDDNGDQNFDTFGMKAQ